MREKPTDREADGVFGELLNEGQSIWLDYIRRDMLENGELAALVDEGIRGVTSNPSIFEAAIANTDLYDEDIRRMLEGDAVDGPTSLYEALAIHDIVQACDVLRPVYEASDGADGFVSFEVSPLLAHDTGATIDEARRLWSAVGRPNLMIKVPATPAGIPAIEELIGDGINVNVTLIFSLNAYRDVVNAYISGLERSGDPASIASVASFFVSRVDSEVDRRLEEIGSDEALGLRGRIAIANSRLAYAIYQKAFSSDRWERLAEQGARPQRLLWASTSTKNPDYNDVMYIEELVGDNTVNTVPPQTLDAFRDHGKVTADAIESDLAQARADMELLAASGVDIDDVTDVLIEEGVKKFADAFDQLIEAIDSKRASVA